MSTYKEGAAVLVAAAASASGVGLIPGFTTPDGALDHMNEVKSSISTLDLDMRAAASRLPANTLAAWETFKDEWRVFYAENEGWFARFMGPGEIDDRTGSFAVKVIAFRALLAKRGEEVSGPEPDKPAPPILSQLATATSSSSGYITAGLVIAGIVAVGYAVKQVRGVLP